MAAERVTAPSPEPNAAAMDGVQRPVMVLETDSLSSDDFGDLMELDDEILMTGGEAVGPQLLRLCCEAFGDTCFVTRAGGQAVGVVLAFPRAAGLLLDHRGRPCVR